MKFSELLEMTAGRPAFEVSNLMVEPNLKEKDPGRVVRKVWVEFPGLLHRVGMSPQKSQNFRIKLEADTPPAGRRPLGTDGRPRGMRPGRQSLRVGPRPFAIQERDADRLSSDSVRRALRAHRCHGAMHDFPVGANTGSAV